MATRAQVRAFVAAERSAAALASRSCGVSVPVILAQWALETGYGLSPLARRCHNLAGIRFYGKPGTTDDGGFACYPNVAHFVADYVATMLLPYYVHVRAAHGIPAEITALGKSPWDAGHYGHPPGVNLMAVYHVIAPYLT